MCCLSSVNTASFWLYWRHAEHAYVANLLVHSSRLPFTHYGGCLPSLPLRGCMHGHMSKVEHAVTEPSIHVFQWRPKLHIGYSR